jgi:hypothetical protein
MTQVQLDRHPFAKHIFYRGTYTHNSVGYFFKLSVEETENSAQPAILVEFGAETRLLPFDYGKARKEILAIYLPDGKVD